MYVVVWTYFAMLLSIPASETRPPTSQAILSMHSSDSIRAMYMSWTLSTMLAAGDSSRNTSEIEDYPGNIILIYL